uniref:AB hydrolase-1 domain-containing protein n=1 Tax=Phytophthora ramorum TaxID=164328 RepID=H3HDA6_PHYRM
MAEQEPVKRPRLAPWKVVAVLAVLVLLTPVWIAYGFLGALLTLPSSTIATSGLQLLAALGLWISVQVFITKPGEEATNTWATLELVGWIVALLLAQGKLDQLLVFHLNQKSDKRRVDVVGIAMLGIFAATAAVSSKANVTNFEDLSRHYDVWDYVNEIMVEALENWRKELKIDKFYLGGHSMGAMFATSYAVKYPGRVEHLALISPAGVGHPPAPKNLPLGLRIFRSVWNLRLTPMSVARYAGPLGPRFLHFIASVRVSVMPETSCIRHGLIPLDALGAYWYNNWALEKSGEIAMHSHLLPGAFAKRPLCEMLTPEAIHIPITFLYGGGPDWMSSSHGEEVAKTFEGKQSVEVVLVPGAGHQLFMDNAPAFNQMLLAALASFGAEAVLLAAGVATESRLWHWVPASYAKLEEAERKILTRAIPTPFEMKKVAQLGTVVVPCSDEKKRKDAKNLVLIHGFAGGNAVWAMNLEKLSRHFNVYAVEWIGVGRSDRPDFNFKDYDSADDFIVGSFEKWRQEIELDKFDLCAHSMGHLVLASPAGVPHPPPPPDPTTEEGKAVNKSWLRRMVYSAWEQGMTPMSLARFVGPYGPKLVQSVVHRRASFMSEGSAMRDGRVDLTEFGEYIYHNWALKPSGERAMTTHLAPGAHAIRPLVDVLLPENVKMPLTFIYGEFDWMDYHNGQGIVERFKEKGRAADLYRVPDGGHQMFLENPDEFSRVLIDSLTR